MTMSDDGKAAFSSLEHPKKAEDPIVKIPSSKLRSISESKLLHAPLPISRTLPGILMLDGVSKQVNTFPRRTTKLAMIVQPEPLMEVTPDLSNAEPTIVVTESGRVRVVRQTQPATK
jgi:hypothetical protein